jgi:hypothetical protein
MASLRSGFLGLLRLVPREVQASVQRLLESIVFKDELSGSGASVTGAIDHGTLSGLNDNDHTQYVNAVSDTASVDLTLTGQSISGAVILGGIDHGGLAGLADNDHTQYVNAVSDTATIDLTLTGQSISGSVIFSGSCITLLSSIGSIDAKTVATTNLYTVPAGKTAIVTGCIVRCTAADTVTVVPSAGVGVAAGEDDIIGSTALTGLNVAGLYYGFSIDGVATSVAAAGVIKLGIDVGATATTMTIAVDLFGYLV